MLPDFLVIGAQKSGTTFLMSALEQSANMIPPALKELHYFDVNFAKGERWYRGLFPTSSEIVARESRIGSKVVTGEASPFYMYYPHAAARAKRSVPSAGIIAVLRDPVERAISHYYHSKAWGFETLELEAAFAAEETRLAPEKERVAEDPNYVSRPLGNYSYVDRGHYVRQLRAWERQFGREQMLILDSRRLFANPQESLSDVCNFLGIPDFRYVGGASKNITSGKELVSDAFREQLRQLFRESNDELFEYAGIRF